MTHEFRLTIASIPGSPTGHLEISGSLGVSLADSADGQLTVAIIASSDQIGRARDVANHCATSKVEPAAIDPGRVGCVVVDHRDGTVAVVAPPIGHQQIYWRCIGNRLCLDSRTPPLATMGGAHPMLDVDALYRYVYFHMVPGPTTIFAGVAKLEGGHWLQWNGARVDVRRYWAPRFEDSPTLSEADAAAELRQVLGAAARRSLAASDRAGTFLSGGLDSSTVAGLAAQERPGIVTVSMGFDAHGYDEMQYARIASSHFHTRALEYYVTPEDVLGTLPTLAAAFAEPFGNSSAAAAYQCARIAREHGIDTLLAGDGGDELFGGNERYARQLVFERYGRLPTMLRKGLLEPAVSAATHITRAYPIGKAESYVAQANVPLPDRLQSYNFLHQHASAEVFEPDTLEQCDVEEPLRLLRDEYAVPTTSSAVNRMLFLDWKFTLHENDLVKVSTMCHLAGIAVDYPMLERPVLDFSLRIPGDWKVRQGQLRWFYKRAMADFLPRAIIDKTKHGFGLPFGVWTRTHAGLRALAQSSLASLATRGYFRRSFLDDALRLHREGHASYYGELVWILMVLELWLQHNLPDAHL